MQSRELLRRETLQLTIMGWIIVAFALSTSIFNLIEYRNAIDASNPGFTTQQWERMIVQRKRQLAPRYVEWEILIIAISLGAWLVVLNRHKKRVRKITPAV